MQLFTYPVFQTTEIDIDREVTVELELYRL